jgi:hypothetical protein
VNEKDCSLLGIFSVLGTFSVLGFMIGDDVLMQTKFT